MHDYMDVLNSWLVRYAKGVPMRVKSPACALLSLMRDLERTALAAGPVLPQVHDSDAISVAPPDKYAQRFVNFMLQEVRVCEAQTTCTDCVSNRDWQV